MSLAEKIINYKIGLLQMVDFMKAEIYLRKILFQFPHVSLLVTVTTSLIPLV